MPLNSTSRQPLSVFSAGTLAGAHGRSLFFSSQKGKVMHIADFMEWFDEGFTLVALYAAPWILMVE
jgi:hypothetical protein